MRNLNVFSQLVEGLIVMKHLQIAKKNLITRHDGITLIEIVVAMGLLAGISLAVLQVNKMMLKSKSKYDAETEATLLTNEIIGIFNNPTNCTQTLSGKNPLNGSTNTIINNNVSKYPTLSAVGQSKLKILSYRLDGNDSDANIAQRISVFKIQFEKPNIQNQTAPIARKFKIYFELDAAGNLNHCRSLASHSPEIWTRGSGTDIFYSDNIGVGTTTPQTKLDVTGGIRAGNQTIVTQCSATNEGTQRYNSSLKRIEFCDGSLWKSFGISGYTLQNCQWTPFQCGAIMCPGQQVAKGMEANSGGIEDCWGQSNDYDEASRRLLCCDIVPN